MSDSVGKVSLDAEVDASGIGDEIRREVHAQVLPALKEIQAETARVTGALDAINGRGLDEAAAQADVLAHELKEVRNAALQAEAAEDRLGKARANETDVLNRMLKAEQQHAQIVDDYGRDSQQAVRAYDAVAGAQRRYTDALARTEGAYRKHQAALRNVADAIQSSSAKEALSAERTAEGVRIAAEKEIAARRKAAVEARKAASAKINADLNGLRSAQRAAQESIRHIDALGAAHRAAAGGGGGGRGGGGFRTLFGGDDGGVNESLNKINATSRTVAGQLDFLSARMGALAAIIVVAAIPAIGALGGLIGQLMAGLSAGGPGAIAILGTLKLGFEGLSEGAKSFMKQFDDVDKARYEQIGTYMAPLLTSFHDLTASVQSSFAERLQPTFANLGNLIDQLGPHLVHITDAFADGTNLLTNGLHMVQEPLNTMIDSAAEFTRVFMPSLQPALTLFADLGNSAAKYAPMMATSFGRAIKDITDVFEQSLSSGNFDALMQNMGPIIESIAKLAGGLLDDMLQLGQVVGPTIGPLLDSLKTFFDNVMPALGSTGTQLSETLTQILPGFGTALNALGPFINALLPALGHVFDIVDKLLPALSPVLTALGNGLNAALAGLSTGLQPIYPIIQQLATEFAPILTNLGTALARTFVQLSPVLAKMLTDLEPVVALLGQLVGKTSGSFGDAIVTAAPVVLATITGIANAILPIVHGLTAMPGLITAVVYAFVGWKSITIIAGVLTAIKDVGIALAGLPGKAAGAVSGLKSSLGGIKGLAGGALLAGGLAGSSSDSGVGQGIGAAASIGGGALLGAEIGSIFPGAGTAIGAGVGALAGGVLSLFDIMSNKSKPAADDMQASMDQVAAAALEAKQALDQTIQSQIALDDAFLNSGGKADGAALGAVQARVANLPNQLKGALSPEDAQNAQEAIDKLGLSQKNLTQQIIGGQPIFDALEESLKNEGVGGEDAARAIAILRDQVLGSQQTAATAQPVLQKLVDTMHFDGLDQAGAQIKTAFDAIPQGKTVNVAMPQGPAIYELLKNMGVEVSTNNNKDITVTAESLAPVKDALHALGVDITSLPDGTIQIELNGLNQAADAIGNLINWANTQTIQLQVETMTPQFNPSQNTIAVPSPPPFSFYGPDTGDTTIGRGRADGGMLPGYSPGHDNLLVPMSGGEGVVIPEAMRALGPSWLYRINSQFRSGISRRGYADGGVVGVDDGGVVPVGTPGDPNSVIGVLIQIRDVLNQMWNAQTVGPGGGGGYSLAGSRRAGGFGRSLGGSYGGGGKFAGSASRAAFSPYAMMGGNQPTLDLGQRMMLGALQGLGVQNPEEWMAEQGMLGPMPGMPGAAMAPPDFGAATSALSGLARSGVVGPDIGGLGLDANSSVVRAILSARNRKKNGLSDDQIADLVQQVLMGGGFGGEMTPINTPLIESLTRFRDQQTKQAAKAQGFSIPPGVAPSTMMPGAGPQGNKAGLQPAASNLWDVIAQNFPQIGQIGGVRADRLPYHPSGRALDLMIPGGDTHGGANPEGKALGDQIYQFLMSNAAQLGVDTSGTLWQTDEGGNHYNHIHAQLLDHFMGAMGSGLAPPSAGMGSYPTAPGLPGANIATAGAPVPVWVVGGGQSVPGGGTAPAAPGVAPSDGDLGAGGLGIAPQSLFKPGQGPGGGSVDYGVSGFPQNIPGLGRLGGAIGAPGTTIGRGNGGAADPFSAILGAVAPGALQGIGEATNNVIGDVTDAVSNALPYKAPTKLASYQTLLAQKGGSNPLALAAMAGYPVGDYSRSGKIGSSGIMGNDGPQFDATGRLYSNTANLTDRTFTNSNAQLQAQVKQLEDVMMGVKNQLVEKALKPILTSGVTAGVSGISSATQRGIGGNLGTAAAPPIAKQVGDAVGKAVANSGDGSSSAGNAVSNAVLGLAAAGSGAEQVFDEGGLWEGGPAWNLSGRVERVLNPGQTVAFDRGELGGWNLPMNRMTGMRAIGMTAAGMPIWPILGADPASSSNFYTGAGTNANLNVGADFFGVSQIPILGAIVNLIVNVLLKVLDVQIQQRNTMVDITKDFRDFRGEFTGFAASGRLFSDTSALSSRSTTSEQEEASEKIRIMKVVIDALVKYIIEKVIIPIAKAVGQAALSAAASAASGAGGAFGGPAGAVAGSVAGSVIQSAGNAAINIASEIGTDFSEALTDALTTSITGAFQSLFPSLMTSLFGGANLAAIFDPITAGYTAAASFPAVMLALLGGLFSGGSPSAAGGVMGSLFDEGGVATGVGLMPKAVIAPERVLSPSNTASFDRFVSLLGSNGTLGSSSTTQTHVHAPITVLGGPAAGEQVRDRLLELMT